MYRWWFPVERQIGKTCIIVSIKPDKLSDDKLAGYVDLLGPMQEVSVTKDSVAAGRFFYRIGKGYRGQTQ